MLKRLMDIVLSGIALIVLFPLFPPIAILLKLTGEGEIFYIQKRVGKHGEEFGLIKLATMLKDSPNLPGGDITVAEDPRMLPMGKFLRKAKINELPQIWNVFVGNMSLVGPRPLTPRNFELYTERVKDALKDIKPGLTGVGSIFFRDEEKIICKSKKDTLECYQEDIAPYKGELELWYKENQGLMLDIKVMFLTAWVIMFPGSNLYKKFLKGLPEPPVALRG